MDYLLGIIIFIIVVLVYLHIVSQYKTGNDLEVYEMDYDDPILFQETCTTMQPLIFEYKNQNLTKRTNPLKFMETSKFVMNVKDTHAYYDKPNTKNPDSVCLHCASAIKLMRQDSKMHYFSENNAAFIEDSGFFKNPTYFELDKILKPPYNIYTEYDLLTGSCGTGVPLRYHTKTRKFLYVSSGTISVKMTTWKNRGWLDVQKDFENYDFRSPHNVWIPENDLVNTIQFLHFDVTQGNVLYIPAFWFYSIQYSEIDTVIVEYNYSTMNNKMAFILDIGQYYLQQQNITTQSTKRIYSNVSQLNDMEENTSA